MSFYKKNTKIICAGWRLIVNWRRHRLLKPSKSWASKNDNINILQTVQKAKNCEFLNNLIKFKHFIKRNQLDEKTRSF